MFVNRYRILAGTIPDGSGTTMMVPFSLDYYPVDNAELIEEEFVNKETEKAINPIIDYEKSKFIPYIGNTTQQINEIKLKLWDTPTAPLVYSDLGITNEDVTFRRNRYLNTFLRLSFYDSDEVTNSNFLFSTTYFTQLGDDQRDITGCSASDPNCVSPNPNYNNPLDVTLMPVSFLSSDPISLPKKIGEGYYVYWFNKNVLNKSQNIYVRATLNNAVNGVITQYYAHLDLTPQPYDSTFFEKLNIKYTIFRGVDGKFKYNIDDTNRSIIINPLTTINLYKLQVQ